MARLRGAVLWTAGFGVAYVLLTLALFGVAPFKAFVLYEQPHLSSGEALRFLAERHNLPINMAPFGIPFKLDALGVHVGDAWGVARHVNQVFTVVALALTVIAARRDGGPRIRAELWLAVLTLGTLRSPFAPAYVAFPLLWLFSLWLTEAPGRRDDHHRGNLDADGDRAPCAAHADGGHVPRAAVSPPRDRRVRGHPKAVSRSPCENCGSRARRGLVS